jgi:large subunit ribosomal protein L6
VSRIGKLPVEIPPNVTVEIENRKVKVAGPKGNLTQTFRPEVKIKSEDGKIIVERTADHKMARAQHGLVRSLLSNMVLGVSQGWSKELEIVGTGYRAKMEGKDKLILQVGYSNPVEFIVPEDLEIDVEGVNKIKIAGIDKAKVGQAAAQIRKIRPPEPYKGKGIRYIDEKVKRKVGKTAKVGSAFG